MSDLRIRTKVYSDIDGDKYDQELGIFYEFEDDDSQHITIQINEMETDKEKAKSENEPIKRCVWVDLYLPEIDHLISILKTARKEAKKHFK
jgi:hypothetical protein